MERARSNDINSVNERYKPYQVGTYGVIPLQTYYVTGPGLPDRMDVGTFPEARSAIALCHACYKAGRDRP